VIELPTELFDDIIGLACGPMETAAPERRRAPRFRFAAQATVAPMFDRFRGRAWFAPIYDLSISSVSFTNPHRIKPAGQLLVKIPRQHGSVIKIRCIVQRCLRISRHEEAFLVAAAFEELLDTGGATHYAVTRRRVADPSEIIVW
jgi:hypothetical protein